MSDDSISMPPSSAGTGAGRRRRYDVSPRTALLILLGSTPVSLPTIWAAGSYLFKAQAAIEQVPVVTEEIKEAKEQLEAQRLELDRLRRWQCILGYDPGGVHGQATILPRDRRSECRDGQREREP